MPGAGIDDVTEMMEKVSEEATAETLFVIHAGMNDVRKTQSHELLDKYCKVTEDKLAVNISVTYRPPGQIQELDIEMYQVLRRSLHSNEAVLLGDFNLRHIDWALRVNRTECLNLYMITSSAN